MRTLSVQILCIFLWIVQAISLPMLGTGLLGAIADWQLLANQPLTAAMAISEPDSIGSHGLRFLLNLMILVSVFGLWRMRRWGVYLFAGVTVFGIAVSLIAHGIDSADQLSWAGVIVFGLIWIGYGLVVFLNWSKLDSAPDETVEETAN